MSEFDSQYIQDYLQKTTNIDKDSFNNNYNNQYKFQSDFSKNQKTIEIQDNFKDKDKNDYLLSSVQKQIRKKTIEKIQKSIYKKSLQEYQNQMEDFKNKQQTNNSFKTALTQRDKNLSQGDQQQKDNYNISSKTLLRQKKNQNQQFEKFDLPQNQSQQQQSQNNSVINNNQQKIEKNQCSKLKQNPNISLTSISSNYEIDNFSQNSYQQMLPYLFSPKPSNAKKQTQY
ncbi:hypothetical protein PPERSA_03527 [Pseudocohnilembus persalinus]|uniref:Uncharacterized protein n=1 Tax=Pseudocohnilembus persalinus TaxID=266149 RepID=A0A0V0Q7Y0_PSEPJ|nr:hypothetical protein PPERSA_03527 [Pseudocohnilembus persalinus]|eukprot:KRW98355.1 hypothetical protein PPERSA_03527 [Pseudocohnilembus persalinus]